MIGGTIPGSIIGGVMADKLGRKSTLYIFLSVIMIFSAIPIFILNFNVYVVLLWLIIINFSWSAMTAANWAMVMDVINPKIGATQHEIMCSIANFGDMTISAAAGTLLIILGFQNLFLLSAIIVIPAIITLYPIKSDKIK